MTLSTGVPDVGITVTATLADADTGVTDVVWQWQKSPSYRDALLGRHP